MSKILRTNFFVLITTRLSELARHCCVNGIVFCILESHLKAVRFFVTWSKALFCISRWVFFQNFKKIWDGKINSIFFVKNSHRQTFRANQNRSNQAYIGRIPTRNFLLNRRRPSDLDR